MIAIIGGGISGLAAAFELSQRGLPFRLFEASSRAGGLIRTEHRDGFTIDAAADSMLAAKPSARQLCEQLGLSARLVEMQHPRSAFVLSRNRLFPLPAPSVLGLPATFGGAMRFTLLPLDARIRILVEPFVASRVHGDESVRSFFTRRFGARATELVAQPLLGGIHAGDVAQLSVRSLFPQLIEAEQSGSVLRGLGRRGGVAGNTFESLSGGMETLPQAIAGSLPAPSVRYGSEVNAVTATGDGWSIAVPGGTDRATAVILATPMQVTARLLNAIDEQAAALCAGIPHASSVAVALAWPQHAIAHPLRGSGFVVARQPGARVTACTWTSSKWSDRAPAGYALLRAFIGGVHDPDAIDMGDEELAAIARRELAPVLGIQGAPVLTRIYRWRDASPQMQVGHGDRVTKVLARLEGHRGIFITGRGFRAVGIPDCIADARRAAAAAAEYVRSQHHAKVDRHVRR